MKHLKIEVIDPGKLEHVWGGMTPDNPDCGCRGACDCQSVCSCS